jgi:FkbM family methyltransferase
VLGNRAEILPYALGASEGTADMQVSASDDSSSLLPIGPRQVAEFPGTEQAGVTAVEIRTLSDVANPSWPGPRLLKIDVQGLELDVLRGAESVLQLFDEVFVECSFVELYEGQALADEVVSYLLTHGLRLVGVYGVARGAGGELLQADLLFRRR